MRPRIGCHSTRIILHPHDRGHPLTYFRSSIRVYLTLSFATLHIQSYILCTTGLPQSLLNRHPDSPLQPAKHKRDYRIPLLRGIVGADGRLAHGAGMQ